MMKYELTDMKRRFQDKVLYRIRAIEGLPNNVKKGTLGGWVEDDTILSQDGNCWITEDVIACHGSDHRCRIEGDILIKDHSIIYGSEINGIGIIENDSNVFYSKISGYIHFCGQAYIVDSTIVGNFVVRNSGEVRDSILSGVGSVQDHSVIENCTIKKFVFVSGESFVESIYCDTGLEIKDGYIESNYDFFIIHHIDGCPMYVYKSRDGIKYIWNANYGDLETIDSDLHSDGLKWAMKSLFQIRRIGVYENPHTP